MTDTLRDKMQALREKLKDKPFTALSTQETNETVALLVDCLIGLLPNPIAAQAGALEPKPPAPKPKPAATVAAPEPPQS